MLAFFALFLSILSTVTTTALFSAPVAHAGSSRSIHQGQLAENIAERRERVPEFREISKIAEEMGLRVWLFGGTAAAFAHYVNWDLMRETSASKPNAPGATFQADRFDYDFTNIYRSTQDLDLVVDGAPKEVERFHQKLTERFPYFLGSKDQWEIRALRVDMGEKQALLNNPDFLNQHTDSNSTGMIELSKSGEPVVRDLRDWNAERPQFLQDVEQGKLHYYFSDLHETTSRFKEGKNPPIISVIRYLTKAFQFTLEIRPEDRVTIERIIAEFNPKDATSGYLQHWLERNGPKLFRHATDIAYAWNTLEELGLRRKLIAASRPRTEGSLGWWMNKEPLRNGSDPKRLPRKEAMGKTARQLGLEIVAHETSDFLAYESIRRSHLGIPNVLISRQSAPGETAAYGDGFYTRKGEHGARGTGFHIRMTVDPTAREGVDFIALDGGDYFLWLTRDKLRVIQESLLFDPKEAFEFLIDPKNEDERGIREMFKRKLERLNWSEADVQAIEDVIEQRIRYKRFHDLLIEEAFSIAAVRRSPKFERWLERLLKGASANSAVALLATPEAMVLPKWKNWVERALKNPSTQVQVTRHILGAPKLLTHPNWDSWVMSLFESPNGKDVLREYLFPIYPHVLEHPLAMELLEAILEEGLLSRKNKSRKSKAKNDGRYNVVNYRIISLLFSRPRIMKHPKWGTWVEAIVKRGIDFEIDALSLALARKPVMARSEWERWIETLLYNERFTVTIVENTLSNTSTMKHPKWEKWISESLSKLGPDELEFFTDAILLSKKAMKSSQWGKWALYVVKSQPPEFMEAFWANLLKNEKVLKRPEWPELVRVSLKRHKAIKNNSRTNFWGWDSIPEEILGWKPAMKHPQWGNLVEVAVDTVKAEAAAGFLQNLILTREAQADARWSRWVTKLLRKSPESLSVFADAIITNRLRINSHPEFTRWMDLLVAKGYLDDYYEDFKAGRKSWTRHERRKIWLKAMERPLKARASFLRRAKCETLLRGPKK